MEEKSTTTNANNIANNSNLDIVDAAASTSTTSVDTFDVEHNSLINVCENEFSYISDTEIFDVISNVSILNDSSVNFEGNNSLNNNIYNNLQPTNITVQIREWAISNNIDHMAINNLLTILKPDHPELPLNARTLLRTPRQINVKYIEPGVYYHFGIEQCIINLLKINNNITSDCIEILINIDGLPVAKSTSSQFYPILCSTFMTSHVEIIGIYHGNAKPSDANVFLTDLVNDINNVISNGIYYNKKLYLIKVKAFICDAPAKSFITCIKGHSGYYS